MTQSISANELSAMVASIYDAAIDATLWPRAIDIICQTLGFATGLISVISLPDGKAVISQNVGFDPAWLARFAEYEADLIDLWGGQSRVHALPLDQPAVLSRLNPSALAEDSINRFHREFNQPQGFIDAVAIGLSRDETTLGNVGFNRHRSAGPVGSRELDALHLLIPHLQRAARLSRLIDAERMLAQDYARVLDGLAAPVFLVTDDLGLVHANRAAELMVSNTPVLSLVRGQLKFASAAAHKTIRQALAVKGQLDLLTGACNAVVPLGGLEQGLTFARVVPIRIPRPGGLTTSDIAGAIFLSGDRANRDHDSDLALSVLGLSPAEERVFSRVGRGDTVAQTAVELGLHTSTVRSHLLRVFEKTGTHRQAELVRLYDMLRVPG